MDCTWMSYDAWTSEPYRYACVLNFGIVTAIYVGM